MATREIYNICPLCDCRLKTDSVGYFGKKHCPCGHYRFQNQGSYASMAVIVLESGEENFYFDDMFGDGEKFDKRVSELR